MTNTSQLKCITCGSTFDTASSLALHEAKSRHRPSLAQAEQEIRRRAYGIFQGRASTEDSEVFEQLRADAQAARKFGKGADPPRSETD